jgi:hypothetical protein
MKSFSSIMLLAALCAFACGSGEEREGSPGGTGDSLKSAATPPPPVVTLTGFYIFAHETNTFRPCGSDTLYWVVGGRRTVERLKMKYSQIAIQPLEEVYCEFRGWLSSEPHIVEGTTIVYDGQAFVDELISMRKRTAEDCTAPKKK